MGPAMRMNRSTVGLILAVAAGLAAAGERKGSEPPPPPPAEGEYVTPFREIDPVGTTADSVRYLESTFVLMPKDKRDRLIAVCEKYGVCDPALACRKADVLADCEAACQSSETCSGKLVLVPPPPVVPPPPPPPPAPPPPAVPAPVPPGCAGEPLPDGAPCGQAVDYQYQSSDCGD